MLKPRYGAVTAAVCFGLGSRYAGMSVSPQGVYLQANVPASTPETRLLAVLCLAFGCLAVVLLIISMTKCEKSSRIFYILGLAVTITMSCVVARNSERSKFTGTFDELAAQEVSATCELKEVSLERNNKPRDRQIETWRAGGTQSSATIEQSGVEELLSGLRLQADLPENLEKIAERTPFFDVQYRMYIWYSNEEDRSTMYTCDIRFRTDNYIEIAFETYGTNDGRIGIYYIDGDPITPEQLQEIAGKMERRNT